MQRAERFAVSVHSAHIHVNFACAEGGGSSALFQVGVDQSSEILVARPALFPDIVQREIHVARQAERAPNPMAGRIVLLHLDLAHFAAGVGDHGVKKFRVRHGEK